MDTKQWVIHDGDSGYGCLGRDIDDAIATLYLLGRPELRVLAMTTVFGNNSLRGTTRSAKRLLRDCGQGGIPVVPGAAQGGQWDTPAARFLAEQVAANPGQIAVLATGPLTNIWGALKHHPGFLRDVAGLYCMGGRMAPVRVGWRAAGELNFSADPAAAEQVLRSAPELTLVPSDVCVSVAWGGETLRQAQGLHPRLRGALWRWLHAYGIGRLVRAFHPWDLLPAMAMTHPELFQTKRQAGAFPRGCLKDGWLPPIQTDESEPVAAPESADPVSSSSQGLQMVIGVPDPPKLTGIALSALGRAWPEAPNLLNGAGRRLAPASSREELALNWRVAS